MGQLTDIALVLRLLRQASIPAHLKFFLKVRRISNFLSPICSVMINTTRKGIPRPEYTMSTPLLLVSALSDTASIISNICISFHASNVLTLDLAGTFSSAGTPCAPRIPPQLPDETSMRRADRPYTSTGIHQKQAYKPVGVQKRLYLLIKASLIALTSFTYITDKFLWTFNLTGSIGTTISSSQQTVHHCNDDTFDIHTV